MRKPRAAVVGMIVSCACVVAGGGVAHTRQVRSDYARVADARSSPRAGAPIEVAFRIFSLPDVGTACDGARAAGARSTVLISDIIANAFAAGVGRTHCPGGNRFEPAA